MTTECDFEQQLQVLTDDQLWALTARIPVDCARRVLDRLRERGFTAPRFARALELQAVPFAEPVAMAGFLTWSREHVFSCVDGVLACDSRWQTAAQASYAECSLDGRWLLASHSAGNQKLNVTLYDQAGQVRWTESASDYDCEFSPCGRYLFLALEQGFGRAKLARVLDLDGNEELFKGQGWSLAEPVTSKWARVSNGTKGLIVDFESQFVDLGPAEFQGPVHASAIARLGERLGSSYTDIVAEPNGHRLVACRNGVTQLFRRHEGHPGRTFRGTFLKFHPEGHFLATEDAASNERFLWSIREDPWSIPDPHPAPGWDPADCELARFLRQGSAF